MSVYCIVNQTMRFSTPTAKIYLKEPLAYTNKRAHAMRVTVLSEDSDEPADLSHVASCTGIFLKQATGEAVYPIEGTVDASSGICEVILPASCYVDPGRFRFTMQVADDGTTESNTCTRTVLWVEGIIEKNTTDDIIDPGTPVGSIDTVIEEATAAAQSAQTAATAATAVAYEQLNRPMTWARGSINSSGQASTSTTRVRAMNVKCPYGAVLTCDPTAEYHMVYHNSDQSIARQDPTSGFYHDATYEIPAGSTISILAKYYGSTATIPDAAPFVDLIRVYNKYPKNGGILAGKKLSVMGDSISSYTGYIPTGADAQYTGSNNGVTTVNQMWWKVLCDVTGMEPLVINGWSGSGVTDLGNANKTPMSDESRTSNLGANGVDPDVIIIEGGSNDFMAAAAAKNEPGTWDGKTAATANSSFIETYAQMVRAIQTNYPKACIVALSTCFTNHDTLLVDNGYCWTRTCTATGNVHTAYEYNEAIRKVAGLLHIGYIDVYSLGENDDNKTSFLADGVHPNRFGMNALAMRVAHELPNQVAALLEGWLSRMTGY